MAFLVEEKEEEEMERKKGVVWIEKERKGRREIYVWLRLWLNFG